MQCVLPSCHIVTGMSTTPTPPVPPSETAVGQIVNGKRAITVRTAFMLSRAFGTSPEFWLNLQRDYDVLRFDAHSVQYVPNLVGARPPMNHEGRIHIAG